MPNTRAFEGDTGRQSSSATEQRDTPSRAAGIRWRELYINAAGLTGRKREGERLPTKVKPAPLTAAWEMVKLPEPMLLKVILCVLLTPTSTLPKSTLPGVALSWPEGAGRF